MSPTDQPNLRGEVIGGKYRLGETIGSGGMGVVYDAVHSELKLACAVKVVAPARGGSDHAKRLLREARILAGLSSAYAVRVLDAGRLADGLPYLVMERLTGQPLSALLRSRGSLPLAQALRFGWQVCEALREVHANGIVHRDLKPSNVFVLSEERIKVLDFGLAIRLDTVEDDSTDTASAFVGSPSYMSPEQIRASSEVTPSSDIWAIGVLLFEMLTGQLPFEGKNQGAVLASIVADPHRTLRGLLPSAPAELERLLADCLEKSPSARPRDVTEVQARLLALGAATLNEPFEPQTAALPDSNQAESTASVAPAAARPLTRPAATRRYGAVVVVVALLLIAFSLAPLSKPSESRSDKTPAPQLSNVAAEAPLKLIQAASAAPPPPAATVEPEPTPAPSTAVPRPPPARPSASGAPRLGSDVLKAISTRN
jgi:eukaryotic-like serine/threonine-protein kinase